MYISNQGSSRENIFVEDFRTFLRDVELEMSDIFGGASGTKGRFCILAWLLSNSPYITKSIKTKWNKTSSIINRKQPFSVQDNWLVEYTDLDVQIVLGILFTCRFKQNSYEKRTTLKWGLCRLKWSKKGTIKMWHIYTVLQFIKHIHNLSVEVVWFSLETI